MRSFSCLALLVSLSACSSAPSPSEPEVPRAPDVPAAPSALTTFEGRYVAATGELTIVTRDPVGRIVTDSTLPYGSGVGQMYFHTCSVSYNSSTHLLTGSVQAVNLMGAISGLSAVVDSVSVTGVTPNTGVVADYGNVPTHTAGDCASTLTWTFTNPSNADFTFRGHADGIAEAPIFYDDFESLGGGSTGTQCATNDTVYAFANLSNWSKAGTNVVHGVQWLPNDKAVQFYDTNQITMTTGVAANANGAQYTVHFLAGAGCWASCSQNNAAGDATILRVLRADSSVLASFTITPPPFGNPLTFQPMQVSYTGDGTGNVRLQLAKNVSDNRFGASIDALGIYSP